MYIRFLLIKQLEQSRVVQQSENEGNFHIFYYLYDGLEAENRLANYYLDIDYKKRHRYLRETSTASKTNQEKWKQLKSSFKVLGFKEDEVDSIIRVLAAVLNLGDIEFGEMVREYI
jgi:myosin III